MSRELTMAEAEIADDVCRARHGEIWGGIPTQCAQCRADIVRLVDDGQDDETIADSMDELARLRAEVTTDNSAVIATLQAENERLRGERVALTFEMTGQSVQMDADFVLRNVAEQLIALRARLAEAEQGSQRKTECLTQIATRDDWTSGERRHYARMYLDAARTPSPGATE